MHARRALLYVPGNDLRKIRKAATLGVDCICMDMEDGVAFNQKGEARKTIVTALQDLDFGQSEYLVRINAVGSGLEINDLKVALSAGADAHPQGVVVPKVETVEQVQWVSERLAIAESKNDWRSGGILMIVQIETAAGLVKIGQILASDPRIQAVIIGAEDLAVDIGAVRTPEAWEVFYARSAVVTHAAALGLQAIDMVNVDFQNMEGLRAEALQGARMGFSGKQIIHPNQVGPVQEAFTPSEDEIEHARKVLMAFEIHEREGRGAFAMDGKMVDAPIVKAARRVLERAGKL
jgi:citrate lyase beta subunit